MKYKILTILMCLMFGTIAHSQSFDNLTHTTKFGDIKYNSKLSKAIFKEIQDEYTSTYALIETKISMKSSELYKIVFDEGPSADPSYSIFKINSDKSEDFVGNIGCEKIIIPANGYIYTEGEMNNLYYKKQKFKIQNNKIIEVPQAAYYIGLKSKTRSLITLYAKKDKTIKAAVLPENYDVELVIEENGWFLIKTAFGLTGWISRKDIQVYPPELSTFEGLFMRGD